MLIAYLVALLGCFSAEEVTLIKKVDSYVRLSTRLNWRQKYI